MTFDESHIDGDDVRVASTREFYRNQAQSFSSTRNSGWAGWDKAFDAIEQADGSFGHSALNSVDFASGNFRFQRYLIQRYGASQQFTTIDACAELALLPEELKGRVDHRQSDIIGALKSGAELVSRLEFDLATSFGFMHHVPTVELREKLLHSLLDALEPGGFAVVSFWCFLEDERLAAKADEATARAKARFGNAVVLGPKDRFLGWQDSADDFRFCHSFDDAEIDALVAAIENRCKVISRFRADGKSGTLNEYLVVRSN